MAGTTTNLSLVTWDENDDFDETELNANWTTIDTEIEARLPKDDPATLTSTVTVTGTIQFGSSNPVALSQVTVTDNTNYQALKIAGPILLHASDTATDTVFAIKMDADPNNDDDFRFKINQVGKLHWGNGTTYDLAIGRDSSGDLIAEFDSDVGTATSQVIASPDRDREYSSFGLYNSNLIWNSDFETDGVGGDPGGWYLKELRADVGTSPGATMVVILEDNKRLQFHAKTGSELNGAITFPMYVTFKAGVQYTAKAWLKLPDGGGPPIVADIGFANSANAFADSANVTLTTTPQELTVTWTPVSDVGLSDPVHFYVRSKSSFDGDIVIDDARVYPTASPGYTKNFPVAQTMDRLDINDNTTYDQYAIYLFAISLKKGIIVNSINLLSAFEMIPLASNTFYCGLYSADGVGAYNPPGVPDPDVAFYPWVLTKLVQTTTVSHLGPGRALRFDLASPYRVADTGMYYIALWRDYEAFPTFDAYGKDISGGGDVPVGLQFPDAFPLSMRVTDVGSLASIHGIGTLPTEISADEGYILTMESTVYPYIWIT